MFFVHMNQTNLLIFTKFSVSDQKWMADLLKRQIENQSVIFELGRVKNNVGKRFFRLIAMKRNSKSLSVILFEYI